MKYLVEINCLKKSIFFKKSSNFCRFFFTGKIHALIKMDPYEEEQILNNEMVQLWLENVLFGHENIAFNNKPAPAA